MGKKKKEMKRQTISIDQRIYDWVAEYAEQHGIDFTAAVNHLLADAKEMIIERKTNEQQQALYVAEPEKSITAKKERKTSEK